MTETYVQNIEKDVFLYQPLENDIPLWFMNLLTKQLYNTTHIYLAIPIIYLS